MEGDKEISEVEWEGYHQGRGERGIDISVCLGDWSAYWKALCCQCTLSGKELVERCVCVYVRARALL